MFLHRQQSPWMDFQSVNFGSDANIKHILTLRLIFTDTLYRAVDLRSTVSCSGTPAWNLQNCSSLILKSWNRGPRSYRNDQRRIQEFQLYRTYFSLADSQLYNETDFIVSLLFARAFSKIPCVALIHATPMEFLKLVMNRRTKAGQKCRCASS